MQRANKELAPGNAEDMALMGSKIRALRKDAGMTLAQLSERTGLSIGYLSQVERDISHPSIRTLTDIANVFDVSMGWLFQTPAPEQRDEGHFVVRGDKRGVMHLTPGIREEVLSPDLDGPLKLFLTTLQPGASSSSSNTSHKGAEAGLVLSGTLDLMLEGQTYQLETGDSFSFSSRVPHRFSNQSGEPVVVVWSIAVDASP